MGHASSSTLSELEGEYTVADTGLMPVAVMFMGAAVSLVVVSWFTTPPEDAVIDPFFPSK